MREQEKEWEGEINTSQSNFFSWVKWRGGGGAVSCLSTTSLHSFVPHFLHHHKRYHGNTVSACQSSAETHIPAGCHSYLSFHTFLKVSPRLHYVAVCIHSLASPSKKGLQLYTSMLHEKTVTGKESIFVHSCCLFAHLLILYADIPYIQKPRTSSPKMKY